MRVRPGAVPDLVATKAGQPQFWSAAARSLTWQTFRDVRSIGWWLAFLYLVVPLCFVLMIRTSDPSLWFLCGLGANIMAGISVFGIDNRTRTHLFLANEGVQPHLVWFIKVLSWVACLFLLMIPTFLVVIAHALSSPRRFTDLWDVSLFSTGVLLGTLAIPIFCGMVIRRGITAAMVAVLLLFLVSFPLMWLFETKMLPSSFLLLVPFAFLAVSFGWSREWMMNRPGAGRWVKLAALLVGWFGALFAAYIYVRVEGVPTLEPSRDAQLFSFTSPTSVSASDNAADLYHQAAQLISPMPAEAYQEVNAKALELCVARPRRCRLAASRRWTGSRCFRRPTPATAK